MLFFNLSAFYFFYFAAVGVYVIFLPKVLHDIGYTTFDIGIILAIPLLMKFMAHWSETIIPYIPMIIMGIRPWKPLERKSALPEIKSKPSAMTAMEEQ